MEAADRKKLGLFISKHREKLGLTQGALAEAVGIKRPYLSQIESGARVPSEEVVEKLLLRLGSPMREFVTEVVGDALTPEQQKAVIALSTPVEQLSEHLTPEQLHDFMSQVASVEQLAAHLQTLAGEPVSIGPEGWADLSKEDRRLVQRIINKLLLAAKAEKEVRRGDHQA